MTELAGRAEHRVTLTEPADSSSHAEPDTARTAALTPLSERAAFWCFVAYVAIALPLILFRLGRYHWFFGDEWSFLAERDAGNVGDLFRSHGEHWVTIPVLVYRALFNLVGMRSYAPYQAVVVAAHLTTAVLLRVVMRRAGVRPWTATIVASVFVLFGPGEENIVWAFQIAFVGALMFGLVHLILSDHDGPVDRRDWLGLLAGVASLMCSGVSLVLVVVVGLAVLVRRGWKLAAFHTVPLGFVYAIWYVATGPGGIDNPYGRSATARELVRFLWSGVRGVFEAIGAFRPSAILIAAVLVLGIGLALQPQNGARRQRLVGPLALLAGAAMFLIGTGYTRWFVTPVADTQSRYLYTLAAFALPAIGVGVDAIAQRWRMVAPLLLAVFLVAIVANVDDFGSRPPFNAAYHDRERELRLTLAYSPLAQRVPRHVRLPWITLGWLRDVAAAGELPKPSRSSPEIERQVQLLLGVTQLAGPPPDEDCRTLPNGATLNPSKGDRFGFDFAAKPQVGANWFAQDAIVVTLLSARGEPLASVSYKSAYGRVLEIELDRLEVRIRAADPRQGLVLCPGAGISVPAQ